MYFSLLCVLSGQYKLHVEYKSDATSVQPLWRSHVDVSIIGLVTKDVAAYVAVGGGEEDLRRLKTVWRGISAAADASVVGAAQLWRTMARQEWGKPHKVFFDTYLYQKYNSIKAHLNWMILTTHV